MSPNQSFKTEDGPRNPIAQAVMDDQNLTYDLSDHSIVIAMKLELLVRKSATTPALTERLKAVAENCGTLGDILTGQQPATSRFAALFENLKSKTVQQAAVTGPTADIEIWRLKDETDDAIDQARSLRELGEVETLKTECGRELLIPAVSPNHVAILSYAAGGCPASPPRPAPAPPGPFVQQPSANPNNVSVTVFDSGYIYVPNPDESHQNLNNRVTLLPGYRLVTTTNPPTGTWEVDEPDGLYKDALGELDGISGHGTFIAGLIAHLCPETDLTVVGLRNQEVEIEPLTPREQSGLFETEVAIAHAMLQHCHTQVIQCGFAFPTLDDYVSLPFFSVLQEIRSNEQTRDVAVVAPAGNEQSRYPYWPAALPDVIGVASTNRYENARAWFSNWGDWCKCATRGEDVYSTFVDYEGPIEGKPVTSIKDFTGWARWDGTSFAAPKVSAAIASVLAANAGMSPLEAWEVVVSEGGPYRVGDVLDYSLGGLPVPLPNLDIGRSRIRR